MATDLKQAALELAKQGVKVFPLGKDKKPRTPNGFYDATANDEVIKQWTWDGMIGAAIAPGTVVIDVDPRNGGNETIKLFRDNGQQLPPTRVVRTMSGGFHYYFDVPEDVTLRSKLGPGVDVKRTGKGYVVVPPSPGYKMVSKVQAKAPEWLLAELTVEAVEGEADAPSDAKFFPWEDGTPYGIAALEREIGRLAKAPEGERNNTLNRAAFALSQLAAGGEISRKRAVRDLAEVSLRIGLEPKESELTIASGWKAGEQVPRQARLRAEAVNIETFGEQNKVTRNGDEADDEERFWVDWEFDEEPPPFYLHPIIPKNAFVWVYGATEASKSMVFNLLGGEGSHVNIRWSMYSLENPPSTDRDRLRRIRPRKDNFRLTNEPLDINDPRQLAAMVEREKDWGDGRGTDVIFIDTYSHAFNSRSEDGNAKAIEFARRMRHIMHEVDCTVIVVDHTGYSQEDEPRDASAKRQQCDVGIVMKKAGEWRPGQPARFTMKCTKSSRFANPFYFTGEIRDVRGDIRGLELGWIGEKPRWESPE